MDVSFSIYWTCLLVLCIMENAKGTNDNLRKQIAKLFLFVCAHMRDMFPCLSMSWWYEVWKVVSHINSSLMQCHLKYELKYQFKLNDEKYIFYIIWNYLKWTDKRISEPIKIWRYYKLAEAIKTLHWNIKLHGNINPLSQHKLARTILIYQFEHIILQWPEQRVVLTRVGRLMSEHLR